MPTKVHRSYLVAAEVAKHIVVMAHWTEIIKSQVPKTTTRERMGVIAPISLLVAATAKTTTILNSNHREILAIKPRTNSPLIMLLSPTREWLALRLTPQSLLRVSTLLATTSYSLLSLI